MKISQTMMMVVPAACLAFAVFPYGMRMAGGTPQTNEVSYGEYMTRITESLPEIRKNSLTIERARNAIGAAGSAEDTGLLGSASYGKTTRFASNPFSRPGYETTYTADLGISRKIIQSGTALSAGLGYTQNRPDINYGNYVLPQAYHYPFYYVGFSQSVMKNAFGVVDRFALKDAEMKLAIEKIRKTEYDKTTLNPYKKLYFDWIEYEQRLELLNKSIDNAKSLLEQVNRKFRTGLAENDDVQNATATLLQHRAVYEESLAEFKSMIARIAEYIDVSGHAASSADFLTFYRKAMDAEFGAIPFDRTRSAEIYRLAKNNRRYAGTIAENKLLPTLDVTGKYTRKTQDVAFSSAVGNMPETDYYIGFSISYPLGNSLAASELKEAEIAVAEVNHEFDISKNDYRQRIESLRESAGGLRRVIHLTEERIRALESKYATERKKYLQARMDLNFLISTANTLTSEQMNLWRLKKNLVYLLIDYEDLSE